MSQKKKKTARFDTVLQGTQQDMKKLVSEQEKKVQDLESQLEAEKIELACRKAVLGVLSQNLGVSTADKLFGDTAGGEMPLKSTKKPSGKKNTGYHSFGPPFGYTHWYRVADHLLTEDKDCVWNTELLREELGRQYGYTPSVQATHNYFSVRCRSKRLVRVKLGEYRWAKSKGKPRKKRRKRGTVLKRAKGKKWGRGSGWFKEATKTLMPGSAVSIDSLLAAMKAKGFSLTRQRVGAYLRKLYDDGQLTRHEPGVYTYTPN